MLKPIPLNAIGFDPTRSRTPPHSYEAEQAFLGAVILRQDGDKQAGLLGRVREFLKPEHFAEPFHGRIFQSMLDLADAGRTMTAISLKESVAEDPDFEAAGGNGFLARLVGGAATVIGAFEYAQLVHDLHIRREIIGLGEMIVEEGFRPQGQRHAVGKIVDRIESNIGGISKQIGAAEGVRRGILAKPSEYLVEALGAAEATMRRRPGEIVGISTGLADLDHRVGGMQGGELLILGGRPSMGKTALAMTISLNAARLAMREHSPQAGRGVAFFSLEMFKQQLGSRLLAMRSEISTRRQRVGPLDDAAMARLIDAEHELASVPLYIDDSPVAHPSAIEARCRGLKRNGQLGLIVVDYLQLIGGGDESRQYNNRVAELSEVTRALKLAARRLDVPILALSQLSRQNENRDDKRPQLQDLRESGSIEQDADCVAFIFREQYYLEREEPTQGPREKSEAFDERHASWAARLKKSENVAEVIVAKNRQGPVGVCKLYFDADTMTFSDLDQDHEGHFELRDRTGGG